MIKNEDKKTTDLEWHTEKRIVNDLIPYEKNPRQLTEKQEKDLKKSLEKFNLVDIPAIDADNIIISGHQRCKILQMIGRGDEEIDVRIPNRKLTDDEFKEYNIRANKNTGEFDIEMLGNFEIELLQEVGFEQFELNNIYHFETENEIINSENYQPKFSIIVELESEEAQQQLYNQLNKQGYKCKVMSI